MKTKQSKKKTSDKINLNNSQNWFCQLSENMKNLRLIILIGKYVINKKKTEKNSIQKIRKTNVLLIKENKIKWNENSHMSSDAYDIFSYSTRICRTKIFRKIVGDCAFP